MDWRPHLPMGLTAAIFAVLGAMGATRTVAQVATVDISPTNPAPILQGQTITFTATPRDGGGNALTKTLFWSSDAAAVSIPRAGPVATGLALGSAQITATTIDDAWLYPISHLIDLSTAPDIATLVEWFRQELSLAHGASLTTMSLVSDELIWIGTDTDWDAYNRGHLTDLLNPLAFSEEGYPYLAWAVWRSAEVTARIDLMLAIGTLTDLKLAADAYLHSAVAFMLAADRLHDINPPGGAPLGTKMPALYDVAIDRSTTGMALATAAGNSELTRNLTAVRASARHRAFIRDINSGTTPVLAKSTAMASDAAAALAMSTADWRWQFTYSTTDPNVIGDWVNVTHELRVGPAYGVPNTAGDGVTGPSLLDHVDGTTPDPEIGRALTEFDAGAAGPLTVVSRREMHLIVAEDALANGDVPAFRTAVNTVRSLDGLPNFTGTSVAAATAMLQHERRRNLFLQGRRLQDMYRFGVVSPDWDVGSAAEANPGTLLPIASVGPSASVTVTVDAPVATEDRILATHSAGNDQTVALVDGHEVLPGPCRVDAVHEFTDIALLGELDAECAGIPGEVAVFSVDRAMGLLPWQWQTGAEDVDQTALPAMLTVPVEMWLGLDWAAGTVTDSDAKAGANDDLAYANTLLAQNRAGMQLDHLDAPDPHLLDHVVTAQFDAIADPECRQVGLSSLFAGRGSSTLVPDLTQPVLHVVYVQSLPNQIRGQFCFPTPGRTASILFVPWDQRVESSLAHEIGHAMGLRWFHTGHTTLLNGFESTNLMHAAETDAMGVPIKRTHLSLGQVYRMNADELSWIQDAIVDPTDPSSAPVRSNPEERACQCDPYNRYPCPRLSQDIAARDPAGPHVPIAQWNCSDEIWLEGSVSSQKAAGLLRGRRWYDQTCLVDAPGTRDVRLTEVRILFPNLAPVETVCESRVVLFYDDHAVQLLDLPTSPTPWTYRFQDAVQVEVASTGSACGIHPCVTAHYAPRREVTVHLWWKDAQLKAIAQSDMNDVGKWFTDLYTGIELDVASEAIAPGGTGTTTTDQCSPTESQNLGQDVNVYYVASTEAAVGIHGGFSGCTGGAAYVVTVTSDGASSAAALAHHLGHVLGLDDVTSSTALVFPMDNIMWEEPVKTFLPPFLTLGQIFRMNFHDASWLQVTAPVTGFDCDATTGPDVGKCPVLSADVIR